MTSESTSGHGSTAPSLQWRLIVLISVVLVLVTAIIGAITIPLQNDSLMRRTDEQLRTSMRMALGPGYQDVLSPALDTDGLETGPRLGALRVVVIGSRVLQSEVVSPDGEVSILSAEQASRLAALADAGPSPQTVYLDAEGPYRVLAQPVSTGRQYGVIVLGQSLSDVRRTTQNLFFVFALTALVGVLVASAAAGLLVRRTLKPLKELRRTSMTISDTPLAKGVVELPQRVSLEGVSAGAEVRDLAHSFNQMMDHVEDALHQREASEEKLKQFVADASHELRTPLATIGGYAEFAQRDLEALPTEVTKSLERIHSEAMRMGRIVEDLLFLARLDSGAPLAPGRTLVAPILVESVSDAQITDPEHAWSVEVSEDAAGMTTSLTEEALRHVLGNLLTNARVHTPPGTTVTVSAWAEDAEQIRLNVEDNGPGIPPELTTRIFDRFVRGDEARTSSSTTETRSTGLGLAITAELLRAAGGSVSVSSTPGCTVFSVLLPSAEPI